MAVIGVLVDAEVGDEHDVIADVVTQVAERHLHDAVRVPRARPFGVLGGRHAEQDHAGNPQGGQFGDLLAERFAGVLHHTGQRLDRLRLSDAFPDEQGGDQVVGGEASLGDHAPQGRGATESAQAPLGEAHPASLRSTHRPERVPTGDECVEPGEVDVGQRLDDEVSVGEVGDAGDLVGRDHAGVPGGGGRDRTVV